MTRYRWTGGSVGGLGGQWERKDDDREIARRVLNLLADRRMLWKDFSVEIEEHCVKSANLARDRLGVHLDNAEIGPASVLRWVPSSGQWPQLRALCSLAGRAGCGEISEVQSGVSGGGGSVGDR
jgi:hypothetical protein